VIQYVNISKKKYDIQYYFMIKTLTNKHWITFLYLLYLNIFYTIFIADCILEIWIQSFFSKTTILLKSKTVEGVKQTRVSL
jgi:hypothetical protein